MKTQDSPENWREDGSQVTNEIGDMLAGVFAPLAFLWLFVATMIQGQELQDSRKVMQQQADSIADQHRLAMATARANYKFSLFDKRIAVYEAFNELSMVVNTVGSLDDPSYSRLVHASLASKNIFGDDPELITWVETVQRLASQLRRTVLRISYLEERQNQGTFGPVEQDKLSEFRRLFAEQQQELCDAYDWNKMDSLFLPYLRLPTDIRID